MSRTNILSNNLPSTKTITDSLREIFITKSNKPLSAEEAPELRGQTMQIVGHEAVKLSSENPTTFHEKVAMYSANQTNSEGYVSELSDEEEADLSVSEDQFRYLQSNLKEGFTGEDAQACYESIKNLEKAYQLNAFKLGLSSEDAQKITIGQSDYLATLPAGVNIPERYKEIADLVENYQTDALHLGFSIDQARNINPRSSNYLVGLDNNHESKESIHAAYEKITNLSENQAKAFQLGLDHEKAANITSEQFDATLKQFNAKGKDQIMSLPKSGESQESLDRRTFVSCFQMVTMVPSPSPHQDLALFQHDTKKRSGDPLINAKINAKSAKRNRP
jgi:hypothetical protein